jgi:Zn-dependent protease with chaperone function
VNLDFQAYVSERKRTDDAASHGGAAYAYPGDQRVLRALGSVTPVTLAVEATLRRWKTVSKSEVLATALKVTDKQFPEIYRLGAACAASLHIPVPTIYLSSDVGPISAQTFGTNEDAMIVLGRVFTEHLSDEELKFVIGHECGRIQNNHVVYATSLYYLLYSAHVFVRWIVQPAILALQAWARRAEITCDRAGLICAKALDPALSSLVKLALGGRKLDDQANVDEYLQQLDQSQQPNSRLAELFRSHPHLPKRVAALRQFADTHYFLSAQDPSVAADVGSSLNQCDKAVGQILSIFRARKPAEE